MLFTSMRRSDDKKGTFCFCRSHSQLSAFNPLRFFVRKTAGSKRIFPLSEEKKNKLLSPDSDWKYARLESTSVIPDRGSTAQAGSFRKGMITPLTTYPSGNGFMKTITRSWAAFAPRQAVCGRRVYTWHVAANTSDNPIWSHYIKTL